MTIQPVILSGGSGTRLWPSSRKSLPKQFINFPETGSLFSRTLERASLIPQATEPLIISSKAHGFLCRRAVDDLNLNAHYILEEIGRNTAPAIYFAALNSDPNAVLLIMPSDHWLDDNAAFASLVEHAEQAAQNGSWVTFGVEADKPTTGFGYIQATGTNDIRDVEAFTEKPDLQTAQAYLQDGRHYWNSGIFLVRADTCLESFQRHASKLVLEANECWRSRITQGDETTLPKPALEAVPSVSVDYAIMEKEDKVKMVLFRGGWSDVGTWDNLSALIEKRRSDTLDNNNAILIEASNTFVHSTERTIAVVGVEDVIVVDDDNATLIVGKGSSEKVKEALDQLHLNGNASATTHSFEYRPWGLFENLLESDICKVKRLVVEPGERLSLQYHRKRSEHWVVVSGVASVRLDGRELTLTPGQSVDIPQGSEHSLGNDTEETLEVIEVQMGTYFGEDDIVRVSDPYNR